MHGLHGLPPLPLICDIAIHIHKSCCGKSISGPHGSSFRSSWEAPSAPPPPPPPPLLLLLPPSSSPINTTRALRSATGLKHHGWEAPDPSGWLTSTGHATPRHATPLPSCSAFSHTIGAQPSAASGWRAGRVWRLTLLSTCHFFPGIATQSYFCGDSMPKMSIYIAVCHPPVASV